MCGIAVLQQEMGSGFVLLAESDESLIEALTECLQHCGISLRKAKQYSVKLIEVFSCHYFAPLTRCRGGAVMFMSGGAYEWMAVQWCL